MGQTADILPKSRKVYKFFFRSKKFNQLIKVPLTALVNGYARFRKFQFPTKFTWDWKLEMLTGQYEKATVREFKRLLKPGMTAVDIGAHVGYFTVLSSKLVGRTGKVIAFEPDPANYNLLRSNTSRFPNTEAHNLAISDRTGRLDFFKTIDKTGSHSLIASSLRPDKISVAAVTLADFFAQHPVARIDLIKMDIEGAEPLALSGMWQILKKHQDVKLIMEFSTENLKDGGFSPVAVLRSLADAGFDYQSIEPDGLRPVDEAYIEVIDKKRNHYVNLLIYNSKNNA